MSDSQGVPPPPPPPIPPFPPPNLPPLPNAGRTAPPWERDGSMVQRFIDTMRTVLMQPGVFFRSTRREGGLGAPLLYAIIGVVIGSIGSYLTQAMMPFGPFAMNRGRGLFFSIFFVPIFLTVGLFIGSGILHVLLTLIASTRQPFETTFRVVAYTSGSTSPLNIIPFVGGLVSGIWALIVLIVGSAEAHEVPQGKAAIAVLLPSIICCGLLILVGGALLALIFGAAAASLGR